MSRLILPFALFALLAACSGSNPSDLPDDNVDEPDASEEPAPIYPEPDWSIGDPADHGLDPAGLEAAGDIAAELHSHCLLVIRGGVLVYERYANAGSAEAVHNSWSIAKSHAGLVVGIAIARGDIASIDDPVARYVPEWDRPENREITVGDVVSMTTGLEWSAFSDYGRMATLAENHTEFAFDLDGEVAPGSLWTYHNGGVQILEALIRNATGESIDDYARTHLWSRIGMDASWATDRAGNPTTYANVLTTCRDHARFGLLTLRRGEWAGGEAVIERQWMDETLAPSQSLNRAYGRLFWLNGHEPALSAMMEPKDGILVPEAPGDLVAARGFGNQFIDVIPSLDLVVVRLGVDPRSGFDIGALIDDARFDIHAEILAPILDAIQ